MKAGAKRIKKYRILQVLMKYHNASFTWMLKPLLFVWVPHTLAIICAFASIRYQSFLSFFEFMPFPIAVYNLVLLAVTMLPSTAVHHASGELLRSMRQDCQCHRNKYLRRKLLCLKSFGVSVGPISFIERPAILMIYYLITNHLFTLLIAFPDCAVTH